MGLLEGSCEVNCKNHQHIEPTPRLHLRTRSLVFFCDAATNSVLIFRKPCTHRKRVKVSYRTFSQQLERLTRCEEEEWENSTNFVLIFHGENCYEIESDNRKFMVGLSFTRAGQARVVWEVPGIRRADDSQRAKKLDETVGIFQFHTPLIRKINENDWLLFPALHELQENAFADVFSFLREKGCYSG